jgi:hypothetical protein
LNFRFFILGISKMKTLSPIRHYPNLAAFYDAIRDGSAFEGATPTGWLEIGACFHANALNEPSLPREDSATVWAVKSPAAIATEWGYCMTPAQIAQLTAANDGSQGAGLVVIHDYGAEIHLANWPH